MQSITAESNKAWIDRHELKLKRYLRRNHKREDRDVVTDLLYFQNPDEGKKLVDNFSLPQSFKLGMFYDFIKSQKQITCGIFGDQRMGKDATVCYLFDEIIKKCKINNIVPPRIVTLGNVRRPPFVVEEDMYFRISDIPSGSKEQEVWIYTSEMDSQLPSREAKSEENRSFSILSSTLAQNHQKMFGCCKLASKVDINFIRDMNVKIFKFISPEKLRVEGVERDNFISPLGKWLLPSDPYDFSKVLLAFDSQLFTVSLSLPSWWTEEYSEQFRNVPEKKIFQYIEGEISLYLKHYTKLTPGNIDEILTNVKLKFRRNITKKEFDDYFNSRV